MKKTLLSIMMIVILSVSMVGCQSKKSDKTTKKIDIKNDQIQLERIKNICELATLECRYHNVARSTKGRDFNFIQKDVDFWIEYDSVAEISFDISKINCTVEDDNRVTIVLPEPQITCTIDPDSWSESNIVKSSSGLIKNKIKSGDIQKAMNNSEEDMKEELINNSGLITTAKLQAEETIRTYINQMGEINGRDYQISFETVETTTSSDTSKED